MLRNPVGFKCYPLRQSERKTDREYAFNHITCIIQDPRDKDKLLLSTLGGLLQFDKACKTISRDYKKIINNTTDIIDINLDAGRYLWTCGWGKGLNCFDLETGEWQEYPYDAKRPIDIVGITKKSRDEFWLSTIQHGVGIFNKADHSFRFYRKTDGDERSLLSNTVIKIKYLNNKKSLWVIGDDGINILDRQFRSFRNVAIPFESGDINAFLKDPATGTLYVGASGSSGLFAWDERKRRWGICPCVTNQSKYGLSVHKLFKDSHSVLWLGTRSGLQYLDPSSRTLEMFRLPGGASLPLKDPCIYSIAEDDRHNLWIGTRSEGVFRIDSSRTRITHFQHDPRNPASLIDGHRIGSICSDKFNNVWIATDNGISIYDPATDRFSSAIMDSLLAFGVTKRWINGIVRDTIGRMWITVDVAGLIRVDEPANKHFRFKLFNTASGLNDPTTGQMTLDPDGGIWLINYGLLYINPYDETIRLFDEHNGLNEPMNIDESLYLDPEGNVFIGRSGSFETKNIRDLDFSPLTIKLVLESLEVNGRTAPPGKAADQDHPHILGADQNNLLFRYTGICFQDVEQVLFRYKLEGYDNAWIMAGTGREARYTNLPPGTYRFVFQVSNRGVWLDQESSFPFVIRPFFWKTWWFILLTVIVAGAILYSIYSYRIRELLRLERLRIRIASDLHDDVGSTLSSISILSDILAQHVENPQSAKMVGTIGANAHKMLEKIDDIVWIVNPTNDKFQNLGLRIREFAIPLFESKNITSEVHYDKQMNNLQLSMECRRNIYLIAKEAANNAIKYAECKSVKIAFRQDHPRLIMEISDDGKGFNPDAPTSRNGIKNMKLRAAQINAEIEIQSAPGCGTHIRLVVSLKRR